MVIVLKKTPHKPFATFFIAGYISELVNETVGVCDQGRSMPLYNNNYHNLIALAVAMRSLKKSLP